MPKNDEEMEDVPTIWQDHEQRITTLEVTMSSVNGKMDNVEKAVKESNAEQKQLLNTLIDHHLNTKQFKLSKMWQLILNLFGAGGLIGVVIYALIQFIN